MSNLPIVLTQAEAPPLLPAVTDAILAMAAPPPGWAIRKPSRRLQRSKLMAGVPPA